MPLSFNAKNAYDLHPCACSSVVPSSIQNKKFGRRLCLTTRAQWIGGRPGGYSLLHESCGPFQISNCSGSCRSSRSGPHNRTVVLVKWLSTCPASNLRSSTPGPRSRSCWPTFPTPWFVPLNKPNCCCC
jgi:hypothetical protein